MVKYDLKDPLEFVGYDSSLAGLKVLKARNKDEANPSRRSFTTSASNISELQVFNGTVTNLSLPGLVADLRDNNLWVNCDGYCYIWIPGSNSANRPRPAKFMRLNDLFNWDDYVDSVSPGQTFTPTPSTTVWNRHDSSSGTTKVDYEKLDADLKQAMDDKKKAEDDKKKAEDDLKKAEDDKKKAEDDKKKAEDDLKKAEDDKKKAEDDKKKAEDDLKKAKDDLKKAEDDKKKAEDDLKKAKDDLKKAEDDKKKAEDDKKKAKDDLKKVEDDKKKAEDDLKKVEDELQEVRKQRREMNEMMDRLKENWVNATRVGARPLPPSAFDYSTNINPVRSLGSQPLNATGYGRMQQRISDSGPYMNSILARSIKVYDLTKVYGDDGFETHFWWVIRLDGTRYLVAFDGTGRYPYPTDQLKFQGIRGNYPFGILTLPVIGPYNVFLINI